MNDKDFRELVSKMRSAQVKYFATRSKSVLIESIQLEHAVDIALKTHSQKVVPLGAGL